MSSQTIFKTVGSTSQSVDIFLVQKAAATSPGDPITGLVYNSGGLTCYHRTGPTSTATAISLLTQTVGGAYSSGGFVEVSSGNMPGTYRFDIPNAQLASVGETNLVFNGAANMATHFLKIIVTDMDFYDRAQLYTKALAESYAADGATATPAQLLYQIWAYLIERSYSGANVNFKKLDGSTQAFTALLNAASGATSITRNG